LNITFNSAIKITFKMKNDSRKSLKSWLIYLLLWKINFKVHCIVGYSFPHSVLSSSTRFMYYSMYSINTAIQIFGVGKSFERN